MKRFAAVIAILVIMAGSYRLGQNSVLFADSRQLDLTAAEDVWQVIDDLYLYEENIDPEKIRYGLAKGIVQSLGDMHSSFMSPKESEEFMLSLNGDLEGIGAELRLDDGAIWVVNPLPDSPAQRAGIRPGDLIVGVDGERLGFIGDLFEVISLIRGPKGTEVTLSVIHEGETAPVDITIVRDAIHIDSTVWKEVQAPNGETIPVITMYSFTEMVDYEFEKALAKVMASGYQKLIIDLRFNGGGYLEGAVSVGSHFLDENDPILFIRDQERRVSRVALPKETKYEGEVVILVNESSASASEIIAGLFQDYELGWVIGTKTFGKGSVQEVHPFRDGSMMRITIAEWLTPEGRSIEGEGIEPNQVVELDYDAFREGQDNQLEAALEYLTSS